MTKIVVHKFHVREFEDPDLWAAKELYEWEISTQGYWVLERALNHPEWHLQLQSDSISLLCVIIADLEPIHVTEFLLRWKDNV